MNNLNIQIYKKMPRKTRRKLSKKISYFIELQELSVGGSCNRCLGGIELFLIFCENYCQIRSSHQNQNLVKNFVPSLLENFSSQLKKLLNAKVFFCVS